MSGDNPTPSDEVRTALAKLQPDWAETVPSKTKDSLWRNAVRRHKELTQFTPENLIPAFCEYISWCEDNPLNSSVLTSYQGESTLNDVPKMRMPTLSGLCVWLGIHRDSWGAWRRGDQRLELKASVEWCESILYDAKITGAAAGLLDSKIIVRELGLVERQQIDNKTQVVIQGDEAQL